ncbi:MAG: PQQ-dependent sugar dehydrogenase [Ferruginibacter sp.]
MRVFIIITIFFFAFFVNSSSAQPVLSLTPVISAGLSSPIELVHAGDGSNRIFIVQQGGSILVYDRAYSFLDTFLTVRTAISYGGERGLLSLAFHPGYSNNGLFYIYYTNGDGDLELARYRVSANMNVADTTTKVIVKTIDHPVNSNHNGGELHFGIDGYLYFSTGDGGGGGDVPNNAQNTSVLLGKMLRIDVTTTDDPPYFTVPPANPFLNEVYAFGLRNPFRWNFDKQTNDMWIGDVGQDSWEEINYRPADSSLGVNYGWRCFEGNTPFNTTVGCNGPVTDYNFPVYTYPTQNPSAAITGGMVYRGSSYISLKGYYVAADFYSGIFYKIKYDPINLVWVTTPQTLTPAGMSDFGETEDGELYVVSQFANTVYRVGSDGPVVYTFTGSGNWNDATNWINNTLPPAVLPASSEIIIDPVSDGECVLNIPQTISAGGMITVSPNKKFRITGDLIIQ